MTILGAIATILLGALLWAGFRQGASRRADAGPLGLGLDRSNGNGIPGARR